MPLPQPSNASIILRAPDDVQEYIHHILKGVGDHVLGWEEIAKHPLKNFFYPVSRLVYNASIIALANMACESNDPLFKNLRFDFPEYQAALADIEQRIRIGKQASEQFNQASGPEKSEVIAEVITGIFLPGTVIRSVLRVAKMAANLKKFGTTQPALFHNLTTEDLALRPPDWTAETPQTMAKKSGRLTKYIWVILEDNTLVVAVRELLEPVLCHDGFTETWLRHPELAKLMPIRAAGNIEAYGDFIHKITNQTGHYRANGPHFPNYIEKVFLDNGYLHAKGKFVFAEPGHTVIPTITYDPLCSLIGPESLAMEALLLAMRRQLPVFKPTATSKPVLEAAPHDYTKSSQLPLFRSKLPIPFGNKGPCYVDPATLKHIKSGGAYIYVVTADYQVHVGPQSVEEFEEPLHHDTLAGYENVILAGDIFRSDGYWVCNNRSGHYRPCGPHLEALAHFVFAAYDLQITWRYQEGSHTFDPAHPPQNMEFIPADYQHVPENLPLQSIHPKHSDQIPLNPLLYFLPSIFTSQLLHGETNAVETETKHTPEMNVMENGSESSTPQVPLKDYTKPIPLFKNLDGTHASPFLGDRMNPESLLSIQAFSERFQQQVHCIYVVTSKNEFRVCMNQFKGNITVHPQLLEESEQGVLAAGELAFVNGECFVNNQTGNYKVQGPQIEPIVLAHLDKLNLKNAKFTYFPGSEQLDPQNLPENVLFPPSVEGKGSASINPLASLLPAIFSQAHGNELPDEAPEERLSTDQVIAETAEVATRSVCGFSGSLIGMTYGGPTGAVVGAAVGYKVSDSLAHDTGELARKLYKIRKKRQEIRRIHEAQDQYKAETKAMAASLPVYKTIAPCLATYAVPDQAICLPVDDGTYLYVVTKTGQFSWSHSTNRNLPVKHSSMVYGEPVLLAGKMIIKNGETVLNNHSEEYQTKGPHLMKIAFHAVGALKRRDNIKNIKFKYYPGSETLDEHNLPENIVLPKTPSWTAKVLSFVPPAPTLSNIFPSLTHLFQMVSGCEAEVPVMPPSTAPAHDSKTPAKNAEEPRDEVIPSTTETEASLQDNIPALPSSNADEVLDQAEKVFSVVQNYKADQKKYPDASQVERVASTAAQTVAKINVRTEAAFVGAAIGFVAGIPLGPVGSAMGEVIGGFVGATWSGSIADDAGEIANKATHDLFRQKKTYRPTPEAAPGDYTIPRRETVTEKADKAEARQSHEASHTPAKAKPSTKVAVKPSQKAHTTPSLVLPAAYQGKAKPQTFAETLSQFHTNTQRAAGFHADQTEVSVADAGHYRQRQENILTSMRSASVTTQRRDVPRGRSSIKDTQQEKPHRAQSADRWRGIRVWGWPSSRREYIDYCKQEHVRLQNKVKMNIPLTSVEEWFLSKLPFASASAADRPENHSNGLTPQHASRDYTIHPGVARHNPADYYPRIDPTSTHPITNVVLPAPHHETNAMTATLNAAERNQLIEAKQSMQLHAQQRKEASTTRTMQLHTTQEAFSTASSVFGIAASVSRYAGNQEAAAFLSSVSQITSGISTLLVAKATIAAAGHLTAGAAFGLLTGGLSLVAGLVSLIALFDDSEAAEARTRALMIENAFSALQTANQDISDEIHEFVRLLQQEIRVLGALSSDVLASQGTLHQMNVLAFDELDVLQSLMTMHMDSFNAYFQALLKGSLKGLCYQLQSHLDGTGVQPSPKQIATSLSQLEYWLMCELYNPALNHTALLHISAESITKMLQQQSLPFINMPSFMAGRMRMVLGKTVPLAFLSLPPMTSYFPSVQLYCKVLERNPEYLAKDKGKTVFEQIKKTLMTYRELFVFLKEHEIAIQQSQLTAIEKEIIGAALKESANYETGIQQMLAIVDQYQQAFSKIQPILTDAEKVLETITCQFFFPHGTPEAAPCFWTKKLAPHEQKGTSYLLDCSVFDEDLSYRREFINKLQDHQLKAIRIDIAGQPYLQVTLNTQALKTNATPVTLVHSTLFFSNQNNLGENKNLLHSPHAN